LTLIPVVQPFNTSGQQSSSTQKSQFLQIGSGTSVASGTQNLQIQSERKLFTTANTSGGVGKSDLFMPQQAFNNMTSGQSQQQQGNARIFVKTTHPANLIQPKIEQSASVNPTQFSNFISPQQTKPRITLGYIQSKINDFFDH